MATGVQLQELSQRLRAALGHSLNVAHGIDQEASLREALRRTQNDLWVMHDWPMMLHRHIQLAPAGVRVATVPMDMDFDHINAVFARSDSYPKWQELGYGITIDNLNEYDSDSGETGPEILKYFPQDDSLIELWPVPDEDWHLMFVGRRRLKPLIADTDVCTLDSELIVATTAGQMLARQDSRDAPIQMQKAQAILNRLRARQGANKRGPWLMGTYL